MVRRQRSPLPLEARPSKKITFKFESFLNSQVSIRFVCFTSVPETRECMISNVLNGIQEMHDFKFKAFLQYHRFLLFSNGFATKRILFFQRF